MCRGLYPALYMGSPTETVSDISDMHGLAPGTGEEGSPLPSGAGRDLTEDACTARLWAPYSVGMNNIDGSSGPEGK